MKRSIMIKRLASCYVHDCDYYNNLPKKNAEIILDLIEELGMFPPIEPGRTVSDLDLGVPEWEDE